MEGLLVRIPSTGGAELALRLWRNERADAPVALVVPAMGAPGKFYAPYARRLHAAGLHAAVLDLRGQGESAPRPRRGIDAGYRELAEDDLPAAVRAVRAELPGAPVVLAGHSLGGQLALLSAAAAPERSVCAVVLTAAGSVWWRGFGGPLGVRNLAGSQLFAAASTLLGHWPGERLGFGGRQFPGVMRDWARQGRTGSYRLKGSGTDYEAALAGLALPVLAVEVEHDVLAPPGAVRHLLDKLPAAPVDRWTYTDAMAGGKRLDHFRWVRHSDALAAHIAHWIGTTLRGGI
jgi:predicted alpha/beta hydrolase